MARDEYIKKYLNVIDKLKWNVLARVEIEKLELNLMKEIDFLRESNKSGTDIEFKTVISKEYIRQLAKMNKSNEQKIKEILKHTSMLIIDFK